jgi:recombination endonuclease VII
MNADHQRKRYAEDPEFKRKKREKNNAWSRANRDTINIKRRDRYANDAEYRESVLTKRRKRYAEDPEYREKLRASRGKYALARNCRNHGISVEEFEAMFARQQGACAICRQPFRTTPCIDHCYLTGWARGLLCHGCNSGLGHYHDNPAFLAQASAYMQRWAEHLIVCFTTEENDKMSNQDTSDQTEAAKRIREAILKELGQPFGGAAAPPLDRLEAVARALIDKAEERDLEAIKEVFDRAGGKTQSAPALIEAPRLLNVTWQRPPTKPKQPKPNQPATTPATVAARGSSRSASAKAVSPEP